MSADDWDKAMSMYRKQLPSRSVVMMTETNRPLPKRLTVRTGKAETTRVSVQVMDGNKKVHGAWYMVRGAWCWDVVLSTRQQ